MLLQEGVEIGADALNQGGASTSALFGAPKKGSTAALGAGDLGRFEFRMQSSSGPCRCPAPKLSALSYLARWLH